MSHTPGEWQIEDGNFVYVLDAESGTNRFWAGISAGYIGTGARTSKEEIYANARLIAAAPKLLVALRAMLVATDSKETEAFKGHYDTYLHTVAIPRAIAAIAKATGEIK